MKYCTLVIDDDLIYLKLAGMLIRKAEFPDEIHYFENGKASLDFLMENYSEDNSYTILLDINMPVMNGWEFLDSIVQFNKTDNLHVFMVTSSMDNSDIEKSKQYNIVRKYMPKPISAENIQKIKEMAFS